MNTLKKIDMKLFHLINNTIKRPILDTLFPLITHLGSAILTLIFSLTIIFFGSVQLKIIGVLCLTSLALAFIVIQSLKRFFGRLRPFRKLTGINYIKNNLKDFSFPSGHTSAITTICFIFFFFLPQYWYIYLILIILVGTSRIYIGVHYPSDVAIGAIVGFACALINYFIYIKLNLTLV